MHPVHALGHKNSCAMLDSDAFTVMVADTVRILALSKTAASNAASFLIAPFREHTYGATRHAHYSISSTGGLAVCARILGASGSNSTSESSSVSSITAGSAGLSP